MAVLEKPVSTPPTLGEFVSQVTQDHAEPVRALYGSLEYLAGSTGAKFSVDSMFGSDDAVSRMFRTEIGPFLHQIIGNEDRTASALGNFAIELMSQIISLAATPELKAALADVSVRQMAVYGTGQRMDLLILAPEAFTTEEPQVLMSGDHLDPGLIERAVNLVAARTESLPPDSPLRLLSNLGRSSAIEALWTVRPHVVLARMPKMERLCAEIPPIDLMLGIEASTAGVYARDKSGRLGVTVAYHATGDVGTAITVKGQPAEITAASRTMDTSFARLPEAMAPVCDRGKKGPMSKRAPAPAEEMTFFGAVSKDTKTYVAGSDLGIPTVDPGRMRCVQTARDTNTGDSGAALINADDEVVGFAYQRSRYDAKPAFSDWVWARAVYDVLELQPV